MPAVNLNDASFGLLLSRPFPSMSLDLSNANVTRVLREYQTYRRKHNKHFTLSSEIYSIQELEQYYKVEVMPSQINDEFWNYFQVFLLQRGRVPSTVTKYFNSIRAALKWGGKHSVPLTETFDIFKVPKFRKTQVCLAPFEVAAIYYFDIDKLKFRSDHKRTLKRVRDMFVLSCMLGQRYSDMSRIEPSCFSDNGNIFTIVQQKTGNRAMVNISQLSMDKTIAMEILHRYRFHSPYKGDIGNYNKYLHELLMLIGGEFNVSVISENKILGQIHTISLSKCKAVASHTGRRTFVNYAMSKDINIKIIMKGTGHADLRSFQKYWCEEVREVQDSSE